MSSQYPYRECECGRQIHVGGVPWCDDCLRMLYRGEQTEKKRIKKLALEPSEECIGRCMTAIDDYYDGGKEGSFQESIRAVLRAFAEEIK